MRIIDAHKVQLKLYEVCQNIRHFDKDRKKSQIFADGLDFAWVMLDNQPTVDAEPARHGHWVRNDNSTYSCSECHSWIPNEQHYYARYCLYCGAKMDGGENEANAEC